MRVCERCIEDDGLRGVVNTHADFSDCNFCETQIDILMSCDLDVVIEHMRECFDRDFCKPADVPGVDEKLRENDKTSFDALSLFERVGLYVENDKLRNELASHLSEHEWCERRWFGDSKSESHFKDWTQYCDVLKRHYREAPENTDGPRISLSSIEAAYPDALPDFKLVADLVPETGGRHDHIRFWRVRILKRDEEPIVPHGFTSPPLKIARQPNRMSPAGISMFYGAGDLETAYLETVIEPLAEDDVVWAVMFENVCPLELIDLTGGLMPRSYFGDRGSEYLHESWFFDKFRKEISKPIKRDGEQHVEYTPTQIMTEYFRDRVMTLNQAAPAGLKFASSRTGKPSYVVFADQSQCLDDADHTDQPQLLRTVPNSLRFLTDSQDSQQGAAK